MDITSRTAPQIATGTFAGSEESKHALTTYLSDMIAVERGFSESLSRQEDSDDSKRFAEAAQIVTALRSISETHISLLEAQLNALGGHEASPVKSAWSAVMGAGAAAIESVRKTKVSKSLRDDYAAASLACVSYEMLHTTGLALGSEPVAQIALKHLEDYAKMIMAIGRCLPSIVINELKDEDLPANESALNQAVQNIRKVWSSES